MENSIYLKFSDLQERAKEQEAPIIRHNAILIRHLVHLDFLTERIKLLESRIEECCGERSRQGQ